MRFDNENVYSDDGLFKFSYYECGIKSGMSEAEKIKLVEERENQIYHQNKEDELREQGII